MIKQSSDGNAKKLCEFVISRTAIGRGGEHMPLRWNEGTYDYFFKAPDLDWSMQKTFSRQCMLFFCDRLSCALCPFLYLGYTFFTGDLAVSELATQSKILSSHTCTTLEEMALQTD